MHICSCKIRRISFWYIISCDRAPSLVKIESCDLEYKLFSTSIIVAPKFQATNISPLRYVTARYEYLQLHHVNADHRFSNLLIKMLRNYVKLKHAIKNYTKSKKYTKLLLRKHMFPCRIWSVYVKPRGRTEGPKNLGDTAAPPLGLGLGWSIETCHAPLRHVLPRQIWSL